MINFGVLIISDKGSRGLREDKSGDAIREGLSAIECCIIKTATVPDERELISSKLIEWADGGKLDIVLTTGGTGLSRRDVTPEATLAVIEKNVPGVAEAMRAGSMKKTPL